MENYKTHVNGRGLVAFHTFVKSRLSCVRLIERGTPIRGSQASYSPTSMTGTLRTAASISLTATRLVFRTNTPQTACLRHSKAMHLYHRYDAKGRSFFTLFCPPRTENRLFLCLIHFLRGL